MSNELDAIVADLKQRFAAEEGQHQGQTRLLLDSKHIVDVCRALRDEHGFEMLAALTAVDYWPQQSPRFHLVYQFNSYSKKVRLEVRVPLDGNAPSVGTVTEIYANANWHEREVWDMFGIRFEGHPDLRRILMPYEWEGHPLRKDYPLGYEEVQFSFNYEEIDQRKPRPKK